jgi:glycine/D-amino acid oxidase-like deaminating enzyme/nitrite reductase/ring-hydroxylating ferredoxin subunit
MLVSAYRERSRSCWMDIAPPKFPALDDNLKCDVAVVGSGIAGLSTAYELAKVGKSVVVLDRGPIGRGMTARTSAHITTALDDFYHKYIEQRDEEAARLHFASQAAAANRIGAIAEEEEIACDCARMEARLFLAGDTKEETLDREWRALATVGLTGVTKVSHVTGHKLSDGPAMIIPAQGRFHPLKYLDGLAVALKRRGARLHADTCVTRIEELKTVVHIETSGGHRVSAGAVVMATNAPIRDDAKITKREQPWRSYCFAAEVPKGAIEDVLYWDTEDPYHYVRLHPWGSVDLLIAGGEDHASGGADDAERRFASLEAWARERFPEMGRVRYRWSGQVLETDDYAGFIGRDPKNERIYMVTGDSGQGITHGVVASLILPSLIETGAHEWAGVYAPARKPPAKSALEDEDEVDDEIDSTDELSPGEGGILTEGKQAFAVSRDESGQMRRLSAKCTHAGCTVHWNSFEQCWDCPCHGSHFAPDGTALNAPAVEPLETVKQESVQAKAGASSR